MLNSFLSKLKSLIDLEFFYRNRYVIFLFIFIHTVIYFFILNLTAFAVDEKVYLATFQSILDNDYMKGRYLGWSNAEKVTIQLLYMPAQILVLIGLDPLNAIRIQSTLLSLISLLIILQTFNRINRSSRYLILMSFFLPSMLLWTSLGLREPFIFLWLIMIFTSIIKVQNLKARLAPFMLFLGSLGLFLTKFHVYFIVIASLISAVILCLILFRDRNLKLFQVFILVSLPALIFLPRTIDSVTGLGKSYEAIAKLDYKSSSFIDQNSWEIDMQTTQNEGLDSAITYRPGVAGSTSGSPVIVSNGGQTLELFLAEIKTNEITFSILSKIGLYDYLVKTQKSSLFPNTDSAIRDGFLSRGTQAANITDPNTILKQSIVFLFNPNPFRDNGTIFLDLLGYEILFWILLYSMFIWMLFVLVSKAWHRNSQNLNIFTPIASVFLSIYFVGFSALTEVSYGNAIRHRTILIFPILLSYIYVRELLSKKSHFFSKTIV